MSLSQCARGQSHFDFIQLDQSFRIQNKKFSLPIFKMFKMILLKKEEL